MQDAAVEGPVGVVVVGVAKDQATGGGSNGSAGTNKLAGEESKVSLGIETRAEQRSREMCQGPDRACQKRHGKRGEWASMTKQEVEICRC